jgi:hypothetical protein
MTCHKLTKGDETVEFTVHDDRTYTVKRVLRGKTRNIYKLPTAAGREWWRVYMGRGYKAS